MDEPFLTPPDLQTHGPGTLVADSPDPEILSPEEVMAETEWGYTIPQSHAPEPYGWYFGDEFDLAILRGNMRAEFKQLCRLRSACLTMQDLAHEEEQEHLEQGDMHLRDEARRAQRQERRTVEEIDALLQLHLVMGSIVDLDDVPIETLPQLVAWMLLRRHKSFRPLLRRRLEAVAYIPSSLSRLVLAE
jgi:hypothetical protein